MTENINQYNMIFQYQLMLLMTYYTCTKDGIYYTDILCDKRRQHNKTMREGVCCHSPKEGKQTPLLMSLTQANSLFKPM